MRTCCYRGKVAGTWGPRVDALIKACGWSIPETVKHFGRSVAKIRRGARPSKATEFALRLRKLEEVHGAELEALRLGVIEIRNGERIDWRLDRSSGTKIPRPPDLAALGGSSGPRSD